MSIVMNSLQTGQNMARRTMRQAETRDIRKLCEKFSLNIISLRQFDVCGIQIFSQFSEPNTIFLASEPIRYVRDLITRAVPELLALPCEEILLAHELFHFLEIQTPYIQTRNTTAVFWRWGKLAWRRILQAPSEIGAMGFAKELLGLEYNPQILDILLLYASAPETAKSLGEELLNRIDREDR